MIALLYELGRKLLLHEALSTCGVILGNLWKNNMRGLPTLNFWRQAACLHRSSLTPDQSLGPLAAPNLFGGMRRPRSRYGIWDTTKLHRHTYGVVLKYNPDWLAVWNIFNNMYRKRKLPSRHTNAHCSLDTYATFVWKRDAARHAVCFFNSMKDYVWRPMVTISCDPTGTFVTTDQKLKYFAIRKERNNS